MNAASMVTLRTFSLAVLAFVNVPSPLVAQRITTNTGYVTTLDGARLYYRVVGHNRGDRGSPIRIARYRSLNLICARPIQTEFVLAYAKPIDW